MHKDSGPLRKITPPEVPSIDFNQAQKELALLIANMGRAIYGKDEVLKLTITTLLAGGHLLIEDVPGVGKTTLALALAHSIGGKQHRIQFTSDLLPSDVIGVPIYNQREQRFEFKPGPLFANVVLADEINRTTPKTQSCMLEAMQEGKVSVDTVTFELPQPFMVIATQNPIEHHGTYPLPESQLDRFMMRLRMGYLNSEDELRILKTPEAERNELNLKAVCSLPQIIAMQKLVQTVRVDASLMHYLLAITTQTRKSPELELGVSTRGSLMLLRAAQAWAMVEGRNYCTPDDIKHLVRPVLAHRILVRASFRSALPPSEAQATAELLLDKIVSQIEVPS